MIDLVTVEQLNKASHFLLENPETLPLDAREALPVWYQTLAETRGANYGYIQSRLAELWDWRKNMTKKSIYWLLAWSELNALALRLVYCEDIPDDALWHFLEKCRDTNVFVL